MSEWRGRDHAARHVPTTAEDEAPGLFDRPRTIRVVKVAAVVAVLALFAADFFLHYHDVLGLENVPGFYTVFGFIASVVLIGVAKVLGRGLKRPPDHWEDDD